jgi:hypothetical protein
VQTVAGSWICHIFPLNFEQEFCKYGSNPLEPNVESSLSSHKVPEDTTSGQTYVQFNVKADDIVTNVLHVWWRQSVPGCLNKLHVPFIE